MASSSSEDEADTWPERPTRIQPESVVPLWCVGRRSLLSLCGVSKHLNKRETESVVPLWCVGRRNLLLRVGRRSLLSLCGLWGDEACCPFVVFGETKSVVPL